MIISGTNCGNEEVQTAAEDTGKTLLSVLQEHQIYIDAPCNGKGNCGMCRVRFMDNAAPKPSEKEKHLLSGRELKEGVRLACSVAADTVAPDGRIEILTPGQAEMAVLAGNDNGRAGPAVLKGGNLQKAEHMALPEHGVGREKKADYGIAIDIGTTTLAMELVNLTSGKAEGAAASVNRQRACGADVISRILAANEGKGPMLRKSIQTDLNRMIDELLRQHEKADWDDVKKIAIAGNTAMCHLLLGDSCRTLGAAPFIPADISLRKKSAEEVFERKDLKAEVCILPGISAFAGADIVAGIYCSGMDLAELPAMLLDIGTNGEMAIGNREGFLVTSAAAGPVFEGGNISCGVPGIPGAITHISLKDAAGSCSYETIGGRKAAGFCGTGIIDIVSELVQKGLIDENGTLSDPWFEEGFPISDLGISFSQRDIREVQMGKSAIRAGIETLIGQYPSGSPQKVYLAGGFGCFMDVAKAEQIGLFPAGFKDRVTALGNGALEGAKQFLLDPDGERRVTWIASHAEEINLAGQEQFNELYLQYMFFEY